METVLGEIKRKKIFSIIRSESIEKLEKTVESLYNGGIRVVEVTMNTPGALQGIELIRTKYTDLIVGAGTVLDAETARLAIIAGASFLLAPNLNKAAIKMANRYGVPFIPGVFTPTEVVQAYEAGARVVKVFPVGSVGPKYIKEMKGPLSHIEMIPVGGVANENAIEFLKAGSFALGVGSTLVNDHLIKTEQFAEIERRARQLVEIISNYDNEISQISGER